MAKNKTCYEESPFTSATTLVQWFVKTNFISMYFTVSVLVKQWGFIILRSSLSPKAVQEQQIILFVSFLCIV